MQTNGWLFDLYPLGDRLVLWFITDTGERLRLEDDFPYCVYLGGPPARLRTIACTLQSRGWLRRVYPARGRDLWTGEDLPVLALEVKSYGLLYPLRNWLGALPAGVECYNCDLDVATYYLYARRLHPCAWYRLEAEDRHLLRLEPLEDAFALEFTPPPLTTLTLSLTQDHLIPLSAGNGLALGGDGETLELEAPDIPGLLRDLARQLRRADPDLVLSDWGDEEIIPTLWRWSRETGVRLPLDRETGPVDRKFGGSRSYFSYGRIVYQGAAAPFYGRWHLDRRNSFYLRESGLAGLMQISRIGQMPLQRAARASPGTLITSMQLARATADGILIPWRKGEPERFKTAGELLVIDKGGLTFMPPVGLHFNVAEVDFASMYPTIMAVHNISPETVNCPCCAGSDALGEGAKGRGPLPPPPDPLPQSLMGKDMAGAVGACGLDCPSPHKGLGGGLGERVGSVVPWTSPQNLSVPEAGYHLCRRREGLVPRTLKPILALREQLKARTKEVSPDEARPYKERQNALKWMLVTCFGYLGYKNARFGKIEAHEAVTAHGRDKLLTAKEICEAAGYTVLHGLTDCLWLQKLGATAFSLSFPGGEGLGEGGIRERSHPSPQPSPLAGQRGFGAAATTGPAPTFQKGVQSPPLQKGDSGGFEVRGPQMHPQRWKSPLPPFRKGGGNTESLSKGHLTCRSELYVRPPFWANTRFAPTKNTRLLANRYKKSPLEKGGFRGIYVTTAKPVATIGLLNHYDPEVATKNGQVEPPPSAVPASAGVPALQFHIKAKRYEVELEELCQKVSAATGVKLALEGIYRWLCFMPSKQDPKRPVATRYFGVFEDGSLKVRGLFCRRRDTPPFVRRAQEALLAKMAEAVTPADLMALKPKLEAMAEDFRQRLREGSVRPQDLVITRVLSQKVEDYKVDTPTALAARQLAAAGIQIQPGEKVRYVHAEPKGGPKETRVQAAPFIETLDDYDVGFYLDQLERAMEEVMLPLGKER